MLELRNVSKVYSPGTVNENCLFRHFSLTIPDGQFVSVVGSNGSGKTTMLNIVCGSIPVDEGGILIGGQDITKMREHKRYRNIGRVYQNPAMGTCGTMTILPPVEIKPGRLNIVEGAYACHPELRGYYARTACLTVPPEEQLRRIRARDGEEMLERFRTMWIPMENRYLEADQIREQADFVY